MAVEALVGRHIRLDVCASVRELKQNHSYAAEAMQRREHLKAASPTLNIKSQYF